MAEPVLRARIAAIFRADPALADEVMLRGALVEIVDNAEVAAGGLRLPLGRARAKLAAGAPLLDREPLAMPAGIVRLFDRLAVASLAGADTSAAAEAALGAVRRHALHADQVLAEAIVGHEEHLATLAAGAGVPGAFLAGLADLAVRPLLQEIARRLRPALEGVAWARPYCPVCGAHPLVGERSADAGLTGAGPTGADPTGADPTGAGLMEAAPAAAPAGPAGGIGPARLRCGRCATAWAWTLPACPTCRSGRLAIADSIVTSGAGRWSLFGCSSCRAYLKVADGQRAGRVADLLMDDLETWRLDRAAVERSLIRPTGLGYRLGHGDLPDDDLDD